MVAQLLFLESEDPERDISLYINCPGGQAYAALAIYDTMQYIKPDISTSCVGMAMSAGAMLLSGGAAGKRLALTNAKVMIHQGSAELEGSPADIEIHAREALSIRKRMVDIMAHHTGQPVSRVESDIDRDFFLSAEEAKDYGIIDDIVVGPRPSR